MRKDVRTGAAIGGVLIAVIVVYAIVVSHKGHHDNKKDQQVAIDSGKADSSATNGTADKTGAPDAVLAGHEEHPDAPKTPGRDSLTINTPKTPIPAPGVSSDDAMTADAEAAMTAHRQNWESMFKHGSPIVTETPRKTARNSEEKTSASANNTPPGIITADNTPRTAGEVPAPTGDAETAGAVIPAADTHEARPAPAAPAPATTHTHQIVSGETFSSIARAVYGDAKYYKEIIKANPKVDPTHLKPGMVIVLPDKVQEQHDGSSDAPARGGDSKPHAPAASAPVNSAKEYRVQASDNLYKISVKLYNSPNKVDAIYQLNKDQIGADPAKLKLNMVLKLPEPPTEKTSTR